MDKKNLEDIVLKEGSFSRKKLILATATLNVVLIIILMLMNSFGSNNIKFKDTYIPNKKFAIKQSNVTFYTDGYSIDINKCIIFEDTTLCGPYSITKLH